MSGPQLTYKKIACGLVQKRGANESRRLTVARDVEGWVRYIGLKQKGYFIEAGPAGHGHLHPRPLTTNIALDLP